MMHPHYIVYITSARLGRARARMRFTLHETSTTFSDRHEMTTLPGSLIYDKNGLAITTTANTAACRVTKHGGRLGGEYELVTGCHTATGEILSYDNPDHSFSPIPPRGYPVITTKYLHKGLWQSMILYGTPTSAAIPPPEKTGGEGEEDH